MKTLFKNATVISPFELICKDVLVENSRIVTVEDTISASIDTKIVDASGMYLTPGYVDIHVHGGGGCSVSSGNVMDVVSAANAHAQYGTTTMLPTLYTMPWKDMLRGAEAIKQAMNMEELQATIAGIHFEGPFLSPIQAGAQLPGALIAPADADLSLVNEYLPYIRMFGMAPELPGALEFGQKLAERGIAVSIAHSDAFYNQIEAAIAHGFSDVTHIYSACSTVRRVNAFRVSGVVEAGLERDELTVQVIADGCHLPDSLLRLIYRCKGPEKMCLVTDGLEFSAADLSEGEVYTQANGIPVVCEDQVMKLLNREAFAGSIATMDRLVRTAYAAGIPLTDCIRMATDTPAQRIELGNKGRIQGGYDADILLLDKDLQVRMVMANGNIIRKLK